MSGPAAIHRIEDPFAFARVGDLQRGQIAIAELRRLHDRLAGNTGQVFYAVRGGLDQQQRPQLTLVIEGKAVLRCDRCLGPVDFALNLQSRVLLMAPGTAPPEDDDPDSPEWIEVAAGPGLDLQQLVEDEIVLGMPLSVRHDHEDCSNSDGIAPTGSRASPFSGLAALLARK